MMLLIKVIVFLSVFSSSLKIHNGFPFHFIPSQTFCLFLFNSWVSFLFFPNSFYFFFFSVQIIESTSNAEGRQKFILRTKIFPCPPPAHLLKTISYLETKHSVLFLSTSESSVCFNLYNSI